MAAPNKRPTHVVIHPSLYFRVDGKLQELAVGTLLTLDEDTAKSKTDRKFIEKIGKAKEVGESAKEEK